MITMILDVLQTLMELILVGTISPSMILVIIKTSDSKGIVREVYNQILRHNCITRKVQIVWDDADYENQRPNVVNIMLVENGIVRTSMMDLQAEYNWKLEFNYLSEDSDWDIMVVGTLGGSGCEDYETKNKELKGDTFVITLTTVDNGSCGDGPTAGDGDDVVPPAP